MHTVLTILFSVLIAAVIGGITNHLAIKMLFHPREPIRWFGRRLPFTPGLIPKRKAEIAVSLGEVVSEYLVTSKGVAELLRDEAFQRRTAGELQRRWDELLDGGVTLGGLAQRLWGAEQAEAKRNGLVPALQRLAEGSIRWAWDDLRVSETRLAAVLPAGEQRAALVRAVSDVLAEQLRSYLLSADGEATLRRTVTGLMDQAGGLLGALAGLFVDEDKIVGRIRAVLTEQLGRPTMREAVRRMVDAQLTKAESFTFAELAQMAGIEDAPKRLASALAEAARSGGWLERLWNAPLAELLGERRTAVRDRLPAWLGLGLDWCSRYVDKLFAALDLKRIVEAQVAKFPIDRLERVILSVSGREFRAITWLGALLGGMIGLLQAILFLYVL